MSPWQWDDRREQVPVLHPAWGVGQGHIELILHKHPGQQCQVEVKCCWGSKASGVAKDGCLRSAEQGCAAHHWDIDPGA